MQLRPVQSSEILQSLDDERLLNLLLIDDRFVNRLDRHLRKRELESSLKGSSCYRSDKWRLPSLSSMPGLSEERCRWNTGEEHAKSLIS